MKICSRHALKVMIAASTGLVEILFACQARATYAVSLLPVAASAYGADDINSCSIDHDSVITVGHYQYIAYYGALSGRSPVSEIFIGRRDLSVPGSTFSVIGTGLTMPVGNSTSNGDALSDDHNVIAMGIDANGMMHLAWGMHNTPLSNATGPGYYMSTAAVNGSSWSSAAIQFSKKTTLVGTTNETEVTYPDFLNIPGTNTRLFSYRQGGAGGGSGNGDQYFDRYNPSTSTFTQTRVIDGMDANVNAYLNNLTYDSNGNLLMSWTYRATPNWQTNSNIYFAQSPNNGVSWFQQGGSTSYALPITPATSQLVWPLPQNTSFINQTTMAVDLNNNPMIATYWAPGTAGTTNANAAVSASNNPNLQYMLVYYDGSKWRDSQVSDRTSDTSFDTGGGDVRDLGRPIVLTDQQGRVLVVTRSENSGQGSYANPSTVGNDIVVYWNTTASLDSADPNPWQSITLDTANMGEYEPTYDFSRWAADNVLDLFYEPEGLNGESSAAVSVLEWNEYYYFNPVLGDANGDGKVDATDLQILQSKTIGEHVTGGYSDGDFNNDGVINADDWALFDEGLAKYNASLGTPAPEPAGLVIFLPILFLLKRRRHCMPSI